MVDPEIKHLLEENIGINKANNEILQKLQRYQRWNQIYRVAYWLIIISISFGALYFVQPYISNILNIYTGGASNISNVNFPDVQNVKNLVNQLNNK